MKLDERARHAAAAVREQAAEVDADAVLERIRAPRTRPRWIVPAGAVAVAVALVIAVVAVVLPRIETRPVIDPVVPGDPSPDEPVTPPGDDGAGPGVGTVGTWRRSGSSDLSGPGDQRMAAVASGLDARVAVGSDREGAAIWILPSDGGDWMRVEADLCGEASCVLRDVTVSEIAGQRFVIVGSLDGLPKIWSSEDGFTWQRHDLERRPTTVPGVTELAAVVATGRELVAFGTEQLPDGGSRPVVFTSTDVATWSEGAVGFTGTEAGADVVDATLTSAGDVVATMHVGDGIALLERDGAGWGTRVVAGEPFGLVTTSVHAIRSTDDGELWLLGSSQGPQDHDGQVWRSSDGGATWAAMSGELGGPGDQHVTDAVLVRGTWTAVGYETDGPGSPPRPVVWDLTDDGWRRTDGGLAFEDPGAMLAVTQGPGHSAFVVGDTTGRQGDGEADAAAWTVEY